MTKDNGKPPAPRHAKPVITRSELWMDDVAAHDYEAAGRYLTLKFGAEFAEKCVSRLQGAPLVAGRPNDILRAARLSPLPLEDPGVKRDLMKILNGHRLSPVLVITSADGSDIADGYHRVSLMYHVDPFMEMPLRVS